MDGQVDANGNDDFDFPLHENTFFGIIGDGEVAHEEEFLPRNIQSSSSSSSSGSPGPEAKSHSTDNLTRIDVDQIGEDIKSAGTHNRNFQNDMNDKDDEDIDKLLSQIDEAQLIEKTNKRLSRTEQALTSTKDIKCGSPLFKSLVVPRISPFKRNSESIIENDNETSSFFSTQNNSGEVTPPKRRFPGPAGLLPDLSSDQIENVNVKHCPLSQQVSKIVSSTPRKSKGCNGTSTENANESGANDDMDMLDMNVTEKDASAALAHNLEQAPWKSLLKTLNLSLKRDRQLFSRNIKWVRSNVKALREEKAIPFLAVVVKENLGMNTSKFKAVAVPSMKVMDPSGTILAALTPSFIRKYKDRIKPGTALALRKVSICKANSEIVLSISARTVLCLSSTLVTDGDTQAASSSSESVTYPSFKVENGVISICNGEFDVLKVDGEYGDLLITNDEVLSEEKAKAGQENIFTTVSSSGHASAQIPLVQNVDNGNDSHGLQCSTRANFSVDFDFGDDGDDDDQEFLQALQQLDFFATKDDSFPD